MAVELSVDLTTKSRHTLASAEQQDVCYDALARWSGAIAASIGLAVLAGWAWDVARLRALFADAVNMQPPKKEPSSAR